ncbi:LOB domain-containing protein 6 [Cucurbita maxima]|uniref:LOB domain-containing protein 6 n=1 Tax=Cucurbita maxima TaxID=3661 RepID=A0A6J1K327_CUCMA|nr:LOB domain-containing protein 6 [Cucurbita maxima]
MASTSSNSPCAACKFLRRKCQPECVFAPYFPPDQPQKFANVHKVFGASNVTKLLNELHPHQREDAVNSLAYEADMRLRDPVYGCVGVISLLQHQLCKLQMDLTSAKSELSKYKTLGIGNPAALISSPSSLTAQRNHQPTFNFGRDQPHSLCYDQFFPRDQQQQQQQQQQMMLRRNFDGGTNYDGLLAVNVTVGNLTHPFQQSRAAAGDDRRGTLDHS